MPHIYAEIKLDHDVTAHSNENENKNKKSRVSQILSLFVTFSLTNDVSSNF